MLAMVDRNITDRELERLHAAGTPVRASTSLRISAARPI
jgi:hypothetical protein